MATDTASVQIVVAHEIATGALSTMVRARGSSRRRSSGGNVRPGIEGMYAGTNSVSSHSASNFSKIDMPVTFWGSLWVSSSPVDSSRELLAKGA